MTTLKELDASLTGRCQKQRKLENNTYAIRVEDGIAIRLHATDILTFRPDESVTVTSGGWKTVTTKARLNEFLPNGWGISQERGVWYWSQYANGKRSERVSYTDGDRIEGGKLIAQATPESEAAEKKLRERIRKFAKLCADKAPLPRPSGGDCWICLLKDESGKPVFGDTDHLLSHMDEGYTVPSLVYQAMQEAGCGPLLITLAFVDENGKSHGSKMDVGSYISRAVRSFMYRRFGLAASGGRSTGFAVR